MKNDLEDRTDLTVDDILDLLKLCLGQTFFRFKGKFFEQTDGCPMGSPISMTIGNLVMEYVEDKALADSGPHVAFYRRYVDDTFVIIMKDFTDAFSDKLNSIHHSIQFTHEEETHGKIAFLDVLVSRGQSGALRTSVYRKPCYTGQVLHYTSGNTLEQKRSVVRSLLSRAIQISSKPQVRQEEITQATRNLQRRAYPESFINDIYHQMLSPRKEIPDETQDKPIYVTIPYIKCLSEPIRRVLSQINMKTTFKPMSTLRSLISHPKDRTPPDDERGVVYKISCQDCTAVYIGETGRKTKQERYREVCPKQD
ncbi:uncharacterized protein LOC135395639 [Ornithodoros turicata]|uniref:uncharacterized protein LOC135395639 n=1 Tax=Ornithodoros turicata TaxID=34597 RepID=UPI00313932F4